MSLLFFFFLWINGCCLRVESKDYIIMVPVDLPTSRSTVWLIWYPNNKLTFRVWSHPHGGTTVIKNVKRQVIMTSLFLQFSQHQQTSNLITIFFFWLFVVCCPYCHHSILSILLATVVTSKHTFTGTSFLQNELVPSMDAISCYSAKFFNFFIWCIYDYFAIEISQPKLYSIRRRRRFRWRIRKQ